MSKIQIVPDFKIDSSDISCLAWEWRNMTEDSVYISNKAAIRLLSGLMTAYMRGHGFKMGSGTSVRKHRWKLVIVMTKVATYAFDKFPEMKRFEFFDVESDVAEPI